MLLAYGKNGQEGEVDYLYVYAAPSHPSYKDGNGYTSYG